MKNPFTDSIEAQKIVYLINTNPIEARKRFEKYLKQYPKHYFAFVQYASCLVLLGEFDLAEKTIKEVSEAYKSDTFFMTHQDYIDEMVRDIHGVILRILCYQGRYQEFFDYYHQNKMQLDALELAGVLFYCGEKLGNFSHLSRESEEIYLYRQLLQYKKSDFLKHIQVHLPQHEENLKGNEKSVFLPGFPIKKVLEEISKNIPSDKRLFIDYYADSYIFKYDNCGFSEDGKLVDYIKVICLHDTPDILTLYPIPDAKELPQIDLNYLSKEVPQSDYIDKMKKKIIAPGDLVTVNGEHYLVRKFISDKQLSLLKVVRKHGDVSFVYNGKKFNILKQAIVHDIQGVKIVQKYGSSIIREFEKAKKSKAPEKKPLQYKIGDVLLVDNEELLIIDDLDDGFVVLDRDNKCSYLANIPQYKILYSVNEFQVNVAKIDSEYNQEKRAQILLKKNKENPPKK